MDVRIAGLLSFAVFLAFRGVIAQRLPKLDGNEALWKKSLKIIDGAPRKDFDELKDLLINIQKEIGEVKKELREELKYVWKYMKEEKCPKKTQAPAVQYVKSCAEIKNVTGTTTDGEYQLHLNFHSSKKAVSVYCADMNTTSPKEYITLKASNYATYDYRIGAATNAKEKPSTRTLFEKIRILQDLTVVTDDFRFAKVDWFTWDKTFARYGSGRDCSSYKCSGSKHGKFRMDLTDTGFIFRTPIRWKSLGWPKECHSMSPYDYSEVNKKVVSGNCGGWCGRCSAQNVQVDIDASCPSD